MTWANLQAPGGELGSPATMFSPGRAVVVPRSSASCSVGTKSPRPNSVSYRLSLSEEQPVGGSMNPLDVIRFWSYVTIPSEDDCWNWGGHVINNGYGSISIKSINKLVHRLAYELMRGPIPDGLTIDHLCSNRACVNPQHLEAVSLRENVLRGNGPTAINARKTHCIHGHEFTEENTRVPRAGGRQCRTCIRRRRAEFRERHRTGVGNGPS